MTDDRGTLGRRSFLKASAAGSATFAAALESLRAEQAKEGETAARDARPIRIAIIGCGNMGCGDLAQALKAPGVCLQAACDVWPPNLEAGLAIGRDEVTAKHFPDERILKYYQGIYGGRSEKDRAEALKVAKAAKGYADYREMLEKAKDVEAVIVATPLHTHCEIASACIKAGRHVYCEKMMAKTIEECHSLGKLARDSGLVVQFGHQQHWNVWYTLGNKLIHNDKICGPITHVRAWWNRNGSWLRAVSEEDVKLIDATKCGYKDVNQLRNWRLFWETSGGLMAELACHQIDIVNWYLAGVPTAVVGMGGLDFHKSDWGGDVFDNVQCIFEYPGGVKLTYQSISTNSYDGQGEQFMGPEGTVIVSRKGGFIYREPKTAALGWQQHAKTTKNAKGQTVIAMKAGSSPGLLGGANKQKGQAIKGDDKKGGDKEKDPYHDYRLALGDWADCIREKRQPAANWEMALRAAVPCIMANEAMRKKAYVEIGAELYTV